MRAMRASSSPPQPATTGLTPAPPVRRAMRPGSQRLPTARTTAALQQMGWPICKAARRPQTSPEPVSPASIQNGSSTQPITAMPCVAAVHKRLPPTPSPPALGTVKLSSAIAAPTIWSTRPRTFWQRAPAASSLPIRLLQARKPLPLIWVCLALTSRMTMANFCAHGWSIAIRTSTRRPSPPLLSFTLTTWVASSPPAARAGRTLTPISSSPTSWPLARISWQLTPAMPTPSA